MLKLSDMALRPDLQFGPLLLSPSRRLVEGPGGHAHLAPLVMQVFLLLIEARGRVVTRTELFDQCWGGGMAGDDSLNRAIAEVRRVGTQVAPGLFEIETVPRTGYRLAGSILTKSFGSDGGKPAIALPLSSVWIAAAVVLVTLASLSAGAWLWLRKEEPATIAVLADRSNASIALARTVTADLAHIADDGAGRLTIIDDPRSGADFLARLSADQFGKRMRASLTLVSSRNSRHLWSTSVEHQGGDLADFGHQVSARLGHAVTCGIGSGAARRLDPGLVHLYFAACNAAASEADDRQIALLREITRQAPRFAQGWAELAVIEARLGEATPFPRGEDNSQRRAFRAAAREHLGKASAIEPDLGAIHLAVAELIGHHRWQNRLAVEERGLAADPGYAQLYSSRAQTLQAVGRMMEAADSAHRAVSLAPLSPAPRAVLVTSLAYAGQIEQARRELNTLNCMWPDSPAARDSNFSFHLRFGDPAIVRGMIEAGQISETPLIGRDFLRVRSDPRPANIDALVELGRKYAARRPNGIASNLQMLGQFGRVDDAYRLLESPASLVYLAYVTEVLFRPHMRPIRLDGRFMTLSRRLGLLQYWRASDRWPDFCRDPDLPYDCRAEARNTPSASTL